MLSRWEIILLGDRGEFPSFAFRTKLSNSHVKHHPFFSPDSRAYKERKTGEFNFDLGSENDEFFLK